MILTQAQLKAIVPTMNQARLDTFTDPINETLIKYGITDMPVVAMFIAQVMHESCGCIYTTELASGQAYEGRKDLGNTQKGDGVLYKGRGLIQVTGRSNYAAMTMALDHDFLSHPTDLALPEWAALSAGQFWKDKNLSDLAQPNTDDAFLKVTKRINGGTNGLADRQAYWARAKKVLGVN